ncbi:hypothetical protein LCGC14_3162080 [marine sediment metagenome]|uniref:Uncharacterized protein n=1 Tax=marine sediment metagenome TaxID=412755 RepID=A0A0F8VQV1_9ZZZZ
MSFWKDWYIFIKQNATKNMKRFSIAIGSFIFLVISSIGFIGFDLNTFLIIVYAGVIETFGMIIMSLFGKNGNGPTHNQLVTPEKTKKTNSNTDEKF